MQLLSRNIGNTERRLADMITAFSGSMLFVYFHILWFGFWILVNHGFLTPYLEPFDRFPYGLLTMLVSLEAIFLSTFIMISQNREQEVAQQRLAVEDAQEARSEEEIDDIQKELDDLQQDIDDVKRLMSRIEQRTSRVSERSPERIRPVA